MHRESAGNVSDRVTRVASRHDAQVRDQRREGVVRDLGLSSGDDGEERGLPCIRKANEANISEHLELEDDGTFLSRLTWLSIAWSFDW